MTILIPAYEPDHRLLTLVGDLKAQLDTYRILIVNDGSKEAYEPIFKAAEEKGALVIAHPVNRGKGRALKTGFEYLIKNGETEGVITADSDGQHLPSDIIRIAKKIVPGSQTIHLGSRRFTGRIPLRSRFGNSVTRQVFTFSTGVRLYDTQTGLRGFPPDMLPWLADIPGERFEYEMNMLLKACQEGYSLVETTIETVYFGKNHSSHFNSLTDSFRVYFPILKFSASSLACGLLDFILLLLFKSLFGNLFLAVVGARVISALCNYLANRSLVFSREKKAAGHATAMPRYFILAAIILIANYLIISLLNVQLSVPLAAAKLLAEGILFFVSYWSQRRFVFAKA